MLFFIVAGWILLSEVSVVASEKVLGHVGGSVRIPCSHSLASTNKKYFCRYPCKDNNDKLITSDKPDKPSSGRYRLEDRGDGVFTVIITDLQKSDAGTYWCGVDRFLKDTYIKVNLTVTDAPPSHRTNPPKASPTTAPVRTSRSEEPSSTSTISNSTPPTISPSISKPVPSIQSTVSPGGRPTTLLYTVAGLVSIVIILGLSLITIYCKCRRTTIKSQREVSLGPSSIYSEVKKPNKSLNIPTSFTEQSDEDTLENPLYGSLELEENTVHSHIYMIAD